MSFGTTLKKIRLKHKDSLRGLAKKINLHFTFVDKVEKGTAPISNNFIERIVEVYPDEEKILKKEYLKENLPKVFSKNESIKILEDSEVLNAIKYHTIGSKDMTLVEKIIYIADAIEYGRNYPSVTEIREETFKNLNKGILMEIEHKEKYLESIGKKSHPNTSQLKENILTELSKTYL